MPRSSAIAKSALFFALASRNGSSGSGGENPGNSETPYQYLVKNGYSDTEQNFINNWKSSLNPKPFKDQLFNYLVSIGYNSNDMTNADKYIVQLVNGEIKPTESFYELMQKLVPSITETEINTIMIKLLKGTLTMEEFYKNLQSLNYTESFETMQDKIYELFTKEFVEQNVFDTTVKELEEKIENAKVTPFDYWKTLDNTVTDADKPKFDENFVNMANNTTFYKYMESLLPSATEPQVDKVMLDLISGKLYNKSIYEEMQNYGYEGSEQEMAKWLLALVRGEIKDPWSYAQELGGTSKDNFDYFYNEFLNNGIVNADGGDSYPGSWDIQPIEPGDNFNIYNFYKSLGFNGSQQELYEQLLTLANGLLSGGSASDDIYDLGEDKFPGMWNDNGNEPINYQTVYEWFKSAGYTGTENELKIQMNNIANLIISGTVNGGSADSWPGDDVFEGFWSDGNSPIPVSNDFYEYMKSIGYKEDKNTLDNQILNLCNQFITGYVSGGNSSDNSGMNLDDKFEGEWNISENGSCECITPDTIFGGDADSQDEKEQDKFEGEWNIKEGSSCDCIMPDTITGGNASNGPGKEEFEGSWNNIASTNNFYNYMKVNANYPYSKETLDSQLAEIFNKYSSSVSIDAGSSISPDGKEEYQGQLPEIRNALLQYMINELHFNPTEENIEEFNTRFGEFVNEGNLIGALDGNK